MASQPPVREREPAHTQRALEYLSSANIEPTCLVYESTWKSKDALENLDFENGSRSPNCTFLFTCCVSMFDVKNNLGCAHATGAIAGGPLVMLGDVELGGVNIIQGFAATALMLPTAGLAGILGKRFFDCFDAVSLDWSQRPGTATFHQVPNHPTTALCMPRCIINQADDVCNPEDRPPHDLLRRLRSLTTGV